MAPTDTPSKMPEPTRVEAVPAQPATPEKPQTAEEKAAELAKKREEEATAAKRQNTQQRGAVVQEVELTAAEKALQTPTSFPPGACKADDAAADALLDEVEKAHNTFTTLLDQFAGTADSNNFMVTPSFNKEVKNARQELVTLLGNDRGQGSLGETLKQVQKARDAGDLKEAKSRLKEAHEVIMDKIDKIIAKEKDEKFVALSEKSKKAYAKLASAARTLRLTMQTAFDAWRQKLSSLEATPTPLPPKPPVVPSVASNQTEQPVQQPTTVSTGPATGPTTGPATTTGLPDAAGAVSATVSATPTALPQKAQELMDQFPTSDPFLPMYASLAKAINEFKPGFNWFWMSPEAIQQKAAKQALLTQCESLKSFLEQQWGEVQTKTRNGDLAASKVTLKSMADAFAKFHDDAVSKFSAVPDITPVTTALQTNKEAANAEGLKWSQSLLEIQKEIDTAKTQAIAAQQKPKEAPPAPAAPAKTEDKTSKPVEEVKLTPAEKKEQEVQAMADSIKEMRDTAIKAYQAKPPDKGALIMVGFQALALLISSLKGDILILGEAIGRAMKGGTEKLITRPAQLLTLVLTNKDGKADDVTEDVINTFRNLEIGQLDAFRKNPGENPEGVSPEIFATLQAFRADHPEEFKTLMGDIFEKYGGNAWAEDPDKKSQTVMDFIEDKMTKWVASLPKELLAKARGAAETEEKEDAPA